MATSFSRVLLHEFIFNSCNVDLRLVEFVSDPHFVEFNFGFQKMETSMTDYAYKAATSGSIYLSTISEYDLYCYYVPGLVGEGLSRSFSASIRKAPG